MHAENENGLEGLNFATTSKVKSDPRAWFGRVGALRRISNFEGSFWRAISRQPGSAWLKADG
jgi:hypothetical protein